MVLHDLPNLALDTVVLFARQWRQAVQMEADNAADFFAGYVSRGFPTELAVGVPQTVNACVIVRARFAVRSDDSRRLGRDQILGMRAKHPCLS